MSRPFAFTITGADDRVDPADLASLSREFPFFEVGILVRGDRRATSRYPSPEWIVKLDQYSDLRLAVHINGHAYRICRGERTLEAVLDELLPGAKRVQLNVQPEPKVVERVWDELLAAALDRGVSISIGAGRASDCDWITAHANPEVEVYGQRLNVFALFDDASNGTGTASAFSRPPEGVETVGFAGGVRPANVGDKLVEAANLAGGRTWWIDCETGARDEEDRFDLERVRALLTAFAEFAESSEPDAR